MALVGSGTVVQPPRPVKARWVTAASIVARLRCELLCVDCGQSVATCRRFLSVGLAGCCPGCAHA